MTMSRVFLTCLLGEKEWISGEVLAYDPSTQMMRIKNRNGFVYHRVFNPRSRRNQTDFRLETLESDDA
jgi:hypothetical protein